MAHHSRARHQVSGGNPSLGEIVDLDDDSVDQRLNLNGRQIDNEGFQHGAIKRITCCNFMSYEYMTYCPDPRLNFIVGPNGSGKSTVVCAVFLVMGGHLKALGRSTDLAQFIKHGCSHGWIEVEIVNLRTINSVFRRQISVRGPHDEFFFNGKKVSINRIRREADYYFIQVENLCQFLPQEKVTLFSRLSCTELLSETLNAAGSTGLAAGHEELLELGSLVLIGSDEKKKLQQKINDARAVVERLEGEVSAQRLRLRLIKVIQFLDVIKADAIVQEKQEARKEVMQAVKAAEKELAEKQKSIAGIEKEVPAATTEKIKVQDDCRKTELALKRVKAEVRKIQGEIDDCRVNPADLQKELKKALAKNSAKEQEIQIHEQDLIKAHQELNDAQEAFNVLEVQAKQGMEKQKKLKADWDALDENVAELEQQKSDILGLMNAEVTRQQQLDDAEHRRLLPLRNLHSDIYAAHCWLQQNKASLGFRGEVFGCLFAEINVKDPAYIKYVEDRIPARDLTAFLAVEQEDVLLLSKILRDQRKVRATVLMIPGGDVQQVKDISALRNYGFTSYLINHVECAPAINHLLRKKYQFDTIPVGTAQVDNMTDAIASQTDLFMFYSPTTRYNINSSKYTGKKWTDTNGIRTPTFLGAGGVDENLKSEIEKKIQQFRQREAALRKDIDKLNAQKALLESEMKPLKEIRTRLIRTNNDVQTAKSKIPGCERRVAVAKSSLINIDNLKKQFGTQLQESYDAISRLLEKQVNVMVQQLPELVQKRNLEAAMYRLVLKFEQVKKAAAQEARETLGSFQMKLEQQQQQLGVADEAIQHARNMKKEKRNMARSLSEHDVHEFTEEFSALVGDMEGINRALQDKRQQLNLMDMADQDIIKRYDEAKESLSGLEESFRKANENTRLRKEAMEQKKGNWRRGVQELISKIDDNFKRYMQLLRCRGHVSFMEPQDLDDFKNYGITLSVAFRQSEELQRLERHLQSGGEKSVSTVLYMLALQELTEVPFRFVDEINQGMDAFNERKVFEVMSRIACRENCSQYFVLTPKLLPDLKLPAELCVGIVFREGAKCHQTGDPREQQGIDVLDAFIQQY